MPKAPLTDKERIAFKIGARARKFVMEGCPVEGYEILLTALTEAKEVDSELHALLTVEMEKFDRRLANLPDETD